MTRLQQLREKQKKIIADMRKIIDDAEKEKRSVLNEGEDKRYKELQAELGVIAIEVGREEDLAKLETSTTETPLEDRAVTPDPTTETRQVQRHNGREYRNLFEIAQKVALDNGGYQDFRSWARALQNGQLRSMNEGTDTGGSIFVVPEMFTAEILDTGLETELVRPRCKVWPMTTKEKVVPGYDIADHSSAIMGWSGQWLSEEEEATETDGKFRSIKLIAKKLALFTSASNELLADAMSFEDMLNGGLSRAIGWFLDYSAFNGTGTGQLQGILKGPAMIVIPKESGQPNTTIKYENVVNMFARMHADGHPNAVWIANHGTIPQLLTMYITIGTGGESIPVFREQSGTFTLLGRPVFFTEKVPALGQQSDLSYMDLSQYAMGIRKEMAIEKTSAVYWKSDKTAYRVILRADGMSTWNSVVTPKNGPTLSWCVTLAKRAA